jgi:hypothetical protein
MKNTDLQLNRDKFYTQLNNEVDPYVACQCTSMPMGLDIGRFGLNPINNISCAYTQPEDRLRWYILNDPDVQAFWKNNFNTKIPAPEWAGVMVYAVNRLYGRKIVYYDDKLELDEIEADLDNDLPIYVSMRYPENINFSGKPSPVDGHIVLIVGSREDGSLLINDPYKNHLTGDRDGFKNVYTLEQFQKHFKGYAIRYIK